MKFLYIFSGILLSLICFLFWILFTFSGNDFLKPYIEKVLTNKLKKSVVLETFTLKTNFIDTEMTINKNSKLIINGTFEILKNSFDIDYEIDSKDLNTPFVNIEGILLLKGNVLGNKKEFSIKGEGDAFRSRVKFISNIRNEKLKDIFINAKGLKVEDVLTFVKKPLYSKGMFDIEADIKSLEDGSYKGEMSALIHYGNLDNNLIEKDFGVKLGQTVVYKGKINSNIEGDKLHIKSNIFSNLLQLQTRDTQFDMKNKELNSDYKLSVPKLEALKDIIGISLIGNIILEGNIKKDKNDLIVEANSKWLGGDLNAILFNHTLKADFKNIDLYEITSMLNKPKYSSGIGSILFNMQDIRAKSRDGKIELHVEDGIVDKKTMIEMFELEVPENLKYKISSLANIKKDVVMIDTTLNSDILSLKLPQSMFEIKSATLSGKYFLHVEDLKRLEFVTKRALQGTVDVDGKFNINENGIEIDGKSDFLDAKTLFTLKDNLLHVASDELAISKLTDMLLYPKVFDSFSTLMADYNLLTEQGIFNVQALNGKILPNEFTDIVKVASGFDLNKEVYKESELKGIVDKKKIDFSLSMVGFESHLKIPKGFVDLDLNTIDSNFDVKVENKDFKGNIKGNLDKPTVSLDTSEYIKEKLDGAIDKNVPEDLKEPIRNLLNLFG